MTDAKSHWNEVGDKFSGLGLKLKLHYEEARSEEGDREQVQAAVRRLGDAVEGVFEAMGKAAKDPAVKDDVKQVGQSLANALSYTFSEVSDELRRAFSRTKADEPAGESSAGGDTGDAGQAPKAES
ncbi:MAG: hypothetical protein ACKVWR_14405 [Acidimicrobiales bacterium]